MHIQKFHGPARILSSSTLLVLVAFALAVPLGFLAASGSTVGTALIAAVLLSVVLAVSPVAMLWFVVIGGLVLSGVADLYFSDLRQARWGVILASLGLAVVSVLASFRHASLAGTALPRRWTTTTLWAALFLLFAVISGIANYGFSAEAVIGFKGYFQVWPILLAFALLPLSSEHVSRFVTAIVWVGLLQLPFILHQHLFLVPLRSTSFEASRAIVAQDILVGTFSGSMGGGGAGPAMASLLVVAFLAVIGMRSIETISRWKSALLLPCFLLPIALGEHKIALVLFPLGLMILFEDRFKKNPFKAIGVSALAVVLMVALFVSFSLLPRAGGARNLDLYEYWDETLSYNVGDRGYGNAKLNRTTVYPFWLENHQSFGGSFANSLLGHGPGASKDSRGSVVENSFSSTRFPMYGIGLTGVSGLLWDVGVLGTIAALGFFVSAFSRARKLAGQVPHASGAWLRVKIAEAGIAIMGVSLLHNNMFLYEIGFQTLLMILIGYVLHCQRTLDLQRETRNW